VTKALAGALSKLRQDAQILLAQALAKRGGAAAVPRFIALANKGHPSAREAAVHALWELGHASAALMKAAQNDDQLVRIARIKAPGDVAGAKDFPALVRLLLAAQSSAAGCKVVYCKLHRDSVLRRYLRHIWTGLNKDRKRTWGVPPALIGSEVDPPG
jgi:hypothetical protein